MSFSQMFQDGTIATAPLSEGPDGKAVAYFEKTSVTTGVPNRLLRLKSKQTPPAASPSDKRKAPGPQMGRQRKTAKAEGTSSSSGGQGGPQRYHAMYYKNYHTIGIRDSFPPRKQVFSFGGKSCILDKNGLLSLAAVVCQKLNEGDTTVEEARDWARAEAAEGRDGGLP